MQTKAVALGVNYYIGLSVIRCLGVMGVPVAAVDYTDDAYGFRSRYCSEKLIAPHYRANPEGFIDFLIEYAKKQDRPPVLFPCADPYVEIIDEHISLLREHFLIAQTEPGLYTRLMDKGSLHQAASEHGVNVPETLPARGEDLFIKVNNEIGYPCLLKPVSSFDFVTRFRKKLFQVDSEVELKIALAKTDEAGLDMIVQRLVPGFDDHMHTYDAHLDQNSKVTHWITIQKLRQYPINFGASVYTHLKNVPELHEIGARFLEGVGFKGFAEIEFKKDAARERFYLIEVNVRTTNLNSLIMKAGINMPYLTYGDLTGTPVKSGAVNREEKLAFWYAYEDMLAIRNYIKSGQLGAGQVLKSFFKKKAYAIWDWKDPRPGFSFLRGLARKALNRVRRKNTRAEKITGERGHE